MTEERARQLATRINAEDHHVVATPRTKNAKNPKWKGYQNKIFYVHVLLKYGQRTTYIYTYEEWLSIQQAWSVMQ